MKDRCALHYNWIVTSRCTQKILSFFGMLIDFGRIKEIQEYPHHFELQVINCLKLYNQSDHKNNMVNSQDLIEEIQLNYMTQVNNTLNFN